VLVILLSACAQQLMQERDESMVKISLKTDDGVAIIGNYWPGSGQGVVLLHMMPAAKESWDEFASVLHKEGWSVLAIDLRGHGESVKQGGKMLDFMQFSDAEHRDSVRDVETAVAFLKQKGVTSVFIGGASIGANLALQYQAEHPEVKKTFLLSAGADYKGIVTEPLAEQLREDQQSFLVGGKKDVRSSGDNCGDIAQRLAHLMKGRRDAKVYDAKAHGTDLFKEDPELMHEIVAWLKV